MPETDQVININGHKWVRLPSNSTAGSTEVYNEQHVRQCGGDPKKVRSSVVWSRGGRVCRWVMAATF